MGAPAWIREMQELEESRRDACLDLCRKVMNQYERGLITTEEFASQVNRIVWG